MTPAAYKKLSPRKKILALAKAMDQEAKRCDANLLLAGTWVQDTFRGTADRLRELEQELKV
jgi:hypothetical protein